MIHRTTLSHAVKGSIVISEPDGLKSGVIGMDRDEEFFTLSEFWKSPFSLYGSNGMEDGGREWLKEVERDYGPDALVEILDEVCIDTFGVTWETYFEGEVAIGILMEQVGTQAGHTLDIGFELKSFWTKFISRLETQVDVQSTEDLDGNAVDVLTPITVPMTGQLLRMSSVEEIYPSEVNLFNSIANGSYLQIGYGKTILDEIKNKYHLPSLENPELPVANYVLEFSGDGQITIKVVSYLFRTDTSSGIDFSYRSVKTFDLDYIDYYLNIDGIEYPLAWTDQTVNPGVPTAAYSGGTVTVFELSGTYALNPKSVIRFYGKMNNAWTDPAGPPTEQINFHHNGLALTTLGLQTSGFSLVQDTVFPDTEADGFLTHDLISAIIKRTSGAGFYSEVLGSPNTLARTYDYTGCLANFMHFKGLQLRGYTLIQKPFFQSAKAWWEGVNPVGNLALGYDRIEGEDVIRCWKKEEVFDEEMVILLSNVRQITRSYDQAHFFNLVEIGFQKWESEDISGIDDPQSKREYATILKKLGKKISILSGMIGASLAFETTRRMTLKKSADYKFDNETFILAVQYDEYGFHPELNEEFSDVTGLLNEETRYNKRITSARNLLRWLNYLSGCLQSYSTSEFKFTAGTGNFDMQATQDDDCDGNFDNFPLSEKQNIPVSELFLFLPIVYKIEHILEYDQWKLYRANRHKAIGVSQRDSDHKPFFTKSLEYIEEESKLTLMAWPKEFFNIEVVDDDNFEHELTRQGGTFDCTFDLTFERALCD